MTIYPWTQLVLLARENSWYYRQLYDGLDSDFLKLSLAGVPAVDQTKFWQANSIKDNRLLTGKMEDGIVFKSGGTTGEPKFSVFSREEWNTFTQIFGEGMRAVGLSDGDRIANLFYAGELYASFNFIMKSIEACPVPTLQFGISGGAGPDSILKTIDDFQINVLAGVPTTIVNVAERYAQKREDYPQVKVNKILFGGESMYPDQRQRLQAIFPGVIVSSVGYASVDAGLLGYADQSCGPDEHRVFGTATIFEIVDEQTGEAIDEVDRPGKVLITNLTRTLMPIIRYPVGDIAVWREPASKTNPDRKFLILGRSEEAARVGPVSLYYEDMRTFLHQSDLGFHISAFQLVTRHFDTRDALILRIAISHSDLHGTTGNGGPTDDASSDRKQFDGKLDGKPIDAERLDGKPLERAQLEAKIVDLFNLARPMFAQAAEQNIIHPLTVEWATPSDIEINARTGKLRRVIDQRR